MANRMRLSAHHPSWAKQHEVAVQKDTCSRQPSLAAIHMPSVGRSSDSRAFAKQAFSSAVADNGSKQECFAFSRLQRRGRPGITPGSLFVGDQNWATDHQRTLTARNLTRRMRDVKRRTKDCRKS